MDGNFFSEHLRYINAWWEFMVDWDGGGMFVHPHIFEREVKWRSKDLLMHVRQLYNYSVAHEHGYESGERIARHLYGSLDLCFTERDGALFRTELHIKGAKPRIDAYVNAYVILGLSRFAQTFESREATERALEMYCELDARMTDPPLAERGSWYVYDPESGKHYGKTDNALLHRCEAAVNLMRAVRIAAPDRLVETEARLGADAVAMARFFDERLARPEAGYSLDRVDEDGAPLPHAEASWKSLAHAFEWIGVCFEVEGEFGERLEFLDGRGRLLAKNALAHGLAANGCFRNDFVPCYRGAAMHAQFWPQVEALLGVLWARRRWGDADFPMEAAERMLDFYRRYFLQKEELGGGIFTQVSENGVPIDMSRGHLYKCDHHSVRLCEKVLEYDLAPAEEAVPRA